VLDFLAEYGPAAPLAKRYGKHGPLLVFTRTNLQIFRLGRLAWLGSVGTVVAFLCEIALYIVPPVGLFLL
jgi:hypothetical protein